ncbi:uncharacterized [Tachysurus ichikawai]
MQETTTPTDHVGIMSESVMTRTLTDTPPYSSLPHHLVGKHRTGRCGTAPLRPPSFTHVNDKSAGTDWSVLKVEQHARELTGNSCSGNKFHFCLVDN